jgi:hypothetical protein
MFISPLIYDALVSNHGQESALYILKSMERMAQVQADAAASCEERLQTALRILYSVESMTMH